MSWPGKWRRTIVATAVLACASTLPLEAQDTTAAGARRDSLPPPTASDSARETAAGSQATDTTYPKAPVSPMGALWRSMLLPGWGQAKLHRKLTGAIFVMWEGVTLGMSIKTTHELAYLRETGSASVHAKAQEQQDWLVLLGFNHLFAGIEAYVSAHLWDFPTDLEINAAPLPGGGFGANIQVPFRLR
ncbi:MAG TPA: hypothetical protein VMG41_16985 [Gemmatimonadales bacterium]|nr:hypothetical protein [Gemmatimonadales bacterium]